MRLDAAARYLQDVANDDGIDGIGEDAAAWVVRRTTLAVRQFPLLREQVTLATWASGVGSRWAERTTTIEGERGGAVTATALWVHVDLRSGRPKVLPPDFDRVYGESAAGRTVSARLHHPPLPSVGDFGGTATEVARRTDEWPLRFADFDVLGHVNNAVYWAIVEEHLDLEAPVRVDLEYRGGIDRGQAVTVAKDGNCLWIMADEAVAASVRTEAEGIYS
jgi:acyl-ACP thioesterase